jgi:ribokinase
MAIINFGSINIDHVYNVEHFVAPGETLSSTAYKSVLGGKGANQSIACAKAGAQVKHVGNIHNNDHAFLSQMQAMNVDCTYVKKREDCATGHAIIQVNDEGENAIVLFAGANHKIDRAQIDSVLDQCDPNDWVLLQNETSAIAEIIEAAHQRGIRTAFNPAPMSTEVADMAIDKLSLLVVNEIEAMQLSNTDTVEEATLVLQNRYPSTQVLLTLGKEGVRFLSNGDILEVPSFKVKAVDTTAAGDTFIGYFLAQYSQAVNHGIDNTSEEVTRALQVACAAAAICVTQEGAAPSIPNAEQVSQFLSQQ